MDLQKILDMGGAIEISKNDPLSIRQKDTNGKPFRISVGLPDGYRSANSGACTVHFIFQNDTDFASALERVDAVICDNILPPAGSP